MSDPSNPTDQPLTMGAEREAEIRSIFTMDCGCAPCKLLRELDATRAALVLLQSQFDNLRRDKEEGDRQNALILDDYRKEVSAHAETRERLEDAERLSVRWREKYDGAAGQVAETRERNTELREALKDKQRGMTFTESERNAELVRQVTETREQLAQAQRLLKQFTHPNLYDSDHTRELEDAVYGALELLAALRAKPEPEALRPAESEASGTTELQGGKP